MADGATGVGHVVHQDGHAVLDVAHQNHAVHLVGLLPLLVDEGKLHIQAVGDGRHAGRPEEKRRSRQTGTQTLSDHSNCCVSSPFGSACVRRHDDAVFPLWDIFFDPLKNGRLCIKIVYSNVEEALGGKKRQLIFAFLTRYLQPTSQLKKHSDGGNSGNKSTLCNYHVTAAHFLRKS